MRNSRRMKNKDKTGITDKIITYSIIGIVSITIVLAGMLAYSKKIRDDMKNSTLELQEITNIAKEEQKKTTDVNSSMGKKVEDSKKNNKEAEEKNKEKELINKKTENEDKSKITTTDKKKEISKNQNNNVNKGNKDNIKNKEKDNSKVNVVANPNKDNKEKEINEPTKELTFIKPVEGEIIKEFAKDKLIYSETLKEWITHLGVDIKAEKTTVVKCAEEGRVKAIKNDPRYGLTIIVEHPNGYKTVYANLLSSEFVVENEKVTKGQSLGTVGNTAAFESANEPHLHFEILKDSENIDPMAYIK